MDPFLTPSLGGTRRGLLPPKKKVTALRGDYYYIFLFGEVWSYPPTMGGGKRSPLVVMVSKKGPKPGPHAKTYMDATLLIPARYRGVPKGTLKRNLWGS